MRVLLGEYSQVSSQDTLASLPAHLCPRCRERDGVTGRPQPDKSSWKQITSCWMHFTGMNSVRRTGQSHLFRKYLSITSLTRHYIKLLILWVCIETFLITTWIPDWLYKLLMLFGYLTAFQNIYNNRSAGHIPVGIHLGEPGCRWKWSCRRL